MKERRRCKRYKVDVMEINFKTVFAKYVKILDMSISGLLLQIEKRLNTGSQYTIKLVGRGEELTVKGIVVRSLLSESIWHSGDIIPIYKTSMKFVDDSKEKLKEIVNFIKVNKQDVDSKKEVNIMPYQISAETRTKTTRCQFSFRCLIDKNKEICSVDRCIQHNTFVMSLINKNNNLDSCQYKKLFGNSYICLCPTRCELYSKYKT